MNSFVVTQIVALVSLFLGVLGLVLLGVSDWDNPRRNAYKVLGIMGILVAVVSGFTLLIRSLPPQPTCIAMAGSRVRWVNSYDSSRYVYVDLGNKTYCRIYDNRLYYLGVDYILDQNYEGVPESRP